MMKAAGNRPRGKLAVPLDRSAVWRLLVHEQMRPDFIATVGVGEKDPAQMGVLAQNSKKPRKHRVFGAAVIPS